VRFEGGRLALSPEAVFELDKLSVSKG